MLRKTNCHLRRKIMKSEARKTHLYLAAFLVSILIILAVLGSGIRTLIALSLLIAIVFSAAILLSQRNDRAPNGFLTVAILASLGFAISRAAILQDTESQGISADIRALLLNEPIWLLLPSTIFAALCLQSISRQQISRQHVTSLSPDIAFGTALMISLYSIIRYVTDSSATFSPQSTISALWGSSLIHYSIIFLFFVLISYIARCYLGTISRKRKPTDLLPEEQSLRWFARVLIGTLPLLGFLGTVFGITQAMSGLPSLLESAGNADRDVVDGLSHSFGSIAIAFETTMLGLVSSLIASVSLSYVEKLDTDLASQSTLAQAAE